MEGKKKPILLAALVAAAAAGFLVYELGGSKRPAQDVFVVLRGENVLEIASNLKAEGYVKSKGIFLFETAVSGNFKKLKAGTYDLKNQNDFGIIKKLSRGQTVPVAFTVIPGWSVNDIAKNLEARKIIPKKDFMDAVLREIPIAVREEFGFLDDAPAAAGFEGYLFPDTYYIAAHPLPEDIIRQMLENFSKKLTPEVQTKIEKQDKKIFDIMVMASLLEKEVRTKEDKKIVSGILWKRVDKGWPLQVDSTLLYFLTSDRPSTENKNIDSPYNTYRYNGLPKGPICNPGIESIEAAADPVASDYFFYLSARDGRTVFSKTYAEHLVNVAKYLNN
ncbi:MAG TPA: endolytic transglycosylase MltG [Candidatus Paceibacterota bacterium]|nr:endolytic transglycosylase MltG [Candidatus Pacearchaeota archaeon]HRZ50769.1 endolytic transglycosylase MltG [Candidatus Paceibacterota bacterium]HSA36334.1 endolytic transglycosylase MltG [Candidatus Paceibacterota bacterium]